MNRNTARTGSAIIVVAGLALLAAACGMQQRQSISYRLRRRIECGRVNKLPVGGRLLLLHAHPGGAELPGPRQQRSDP